MLLVGTVDKIPRLIATIWSFRRAYLLSTKKNNKR